jgi:hypothetical protein
MKSTKKTSGGAGDAPRQKDPSPDQIAALAHAIWIDRGRPEGREIDHWLEAERQLRGEIRRPAAANDLPADNASIDPDRTLETDVDRALDRIVTPAQPRSMTSL